MEGPLAQAKSHERQRLKPTKRGSRLGCRGGRSLSASIGRRRRCRGRLPAMVAAVRTGHWSPTQRRSSGPGARNRASWPPTRGCGVWSPPSSTTIGHPSRSPSGCGGSFAVTRRCGSLTSRSIVTCTCRRGKYLTPACSTFYEASVRSDGRAERSAHTVAARSGTWSPSASDRPRLIPGRWPAIGRAISCSERAHRRSPPSLTAPPATRLVIALPHGNKADAVARALIDYMSRLPTHLRRSLTWDRGGEMAQHSAITAALGLPVFFCDPHHPWQRGTNENTNRLLRQYLHRNADLATFTQDELNAVAAKLNHRPRRVLGWATPAEAFGVVEPKPMLRAPV